MNTPVNYIGIDVAKATLQAAGPTGGQSLANTAYGLAQLLKWLAQQPGPVHVVCEATGGYERGLLQALHAASILVSLVNPRKVRAYAQASGYEAKTDTLDAQVIRAYAEALRPAATPPVTTAQADLTALAQEYQHVVVTRVAEQNRLELMTHPLARSVAQERVRLLESQCEKLEWALTEWLTQNPVAAERAERLDAVQGIGKKTALSLLAFIPELGTLRYGQAAALVGVAPFNRDSGQWRGHRQIRGGREAARKALYMAALSASQHNVVLKPFYQRLIGRNKPAKVALTAVMRKLVEHANRLLSPSSKKMPCTS